MEKTTENEKQAPAETAGDVERAWDAIPSPHWSRFFGLQCPRAWRLVDATLLILSATGMTYLKWGYLPEWQFAPTAVILPLVFLRLVLIHVYELYDFEYHNGYLNLAYSLIGVVAFSIALHLGAVFLTEYTALQRGGEELLEIQAYSSYTFPIYEGIVAFVLLAGWRWAYLYIVREVLRLKSRILIVGAGEHGVKLRQDIARFSDVHEVVGFVDDTNHNPEAPLLGGPDDLERLIPEHRVGEVIVTWHRPRLIRILHSCSRLGVRVRLLPDLSEVVMGQVAISQIAGVPLIELKVFGRHGWTAILKRVLDVSVASVMLILTLPLFPMIALLIRKGSSGPVFYSQERVGQGGKPLMVTKFRTMVQDAEAKLGPVLATENDPRITPIGNLLRKTRLDELPQLLSVIRGEMSLVGPRPERPNFVEQFTKQFPSYPFRLMVKPGLTGLAQIYGRYDSSPEDKLRYDLAYINNLTFFVDVRILFKTLRMALIGSRAR